MNCPKCGIYNPTGTKKCECGYIFMNVPDYSQKISKSKPDKVPIKTFLKIVIILSLITFAITFFLKDQLPGKNQIENELLGEPLQYKEQLPAPFNVTKKNIVYTVTPLYNYDLYGLIVSYHESDSFIDISHKRWKDYLNVKDLCVIWGKNIIMEGYLHMTFNSRDFICFCKWPNAEIGKKFSMRHFSNNHLIAEDRTIIDKIMEAKIGDQIHVYGYLSKYSHIGSSFNRGTSTSRTDNGNRACETIFVTDFEIIKTNNPLLRTANRISIMLIILSLIFMVIRFHRSQ